MPICLASERPEVQQKGNRANFRWLLAEPWDERRLAAFLMTKHRRKDADWTRRTSPLYASLGRAAVKGIITGASRIHDEMVRDKDWRKVTPP